MKNIVLAILTTVVLFVSANIADACNRCGVRSCNNCNINHVQHHNNNNFFFRNNALVIPIQVIRLVEVPGLELTENIVVVRDDHGNIVDVRRQVFYDLGNNVKRDKVIIQINEDVFQGHGHHGFNY